MGIAEVEKGFIDNLVQLGDAGSQCDYLMMLGMAPTGKEHIRTEKYRIGGCKTAIWLKAELTGDVAGGPEEIKTAAGDLEETEPVADKFTDADPPDRKLILTADSDSLLVRGVLVMLCEVYNGQRVRDIKVHPPGFVDYISDEVIYPEIKQNGLLKCYQRLAALYE